MLRAAPAALSESGQSKMERYVALVMPGKACWTIRFPDFPGTEATGFPLHMALGKARRQLGARSTILRSLGANMAAPMTAAELVPTPGYKDAMPFILAIPGPQRIEGDNVFRFG